MEKPGFLSQLIYERRSLFQGIIIFICKFWYVNSGWLYLFIRSKAMRGDSFDLKVILTIFSLQEQSFLTGLLLIFKRWWNLKSFFADKSVLPSQLTLVTENVLANCHFSKKDILQIIRNSDLIKTHCMTWSVFVCKNCGDSVCQEFLKCDTNFSNLIIGSVNTSFNGFQVFGA